MSRHCPNCNAPLVNKGEKPNVFAQRQFCGRPCHHAYVKRQGEAKRAAEAKVCANVGCGKLIVRHPKRCPIRFAAKKCCSPACELTWRRQQALEERAQDRKTCSGCGKEFCRNAKEGPAQFKRRQYCGVYCGQRNNKPRAMTRGAATQNPLVRMPSFAFPDNRVIRPPAPGTRFETSEEWLRRNQPTKAPTRYCAPVIQ